MSRRIRVVALVAATVALAAVVPAQAGEKVLPGTCRVGHPKVVPPGCASSLLPPGALPNIVPKPPAYVSVGPDAIAFDPVGLVTTVDPNTKVLRFPTLVANVGSVALELLGEPTADPERWRALQCTSWATKACLTRQEVGELAWHAAHNHFHFQDFADYELRRVLPDGTPDFSAGGQVATSPKVSFCLMDSEANSEDSPPQTYVGCPGALQGISAGWADLYDMGLPGQSLPIAGLADGLYAIVIRLDPTNRLLESNDGDNLAYSIVELYDNGNEARVIG
ncbi:MAG TPA: lysyl oxidase family protein [Acidimicrobiales bacterium]|nr:lysyl oxidase family protein [Acidimicrobiales bacterium]